MSTFTRFKPTSVVLSEEEITSAFYAAQESLPYLEDQSIAEIVQERIRVAAKLVNARLVKFNGEK